MTAPRPAQRTWSVWGLTAQLAVTRPETLDDAVQHAEQILEQVGAACSRFRTDSELVLQREALAQGAEVSEMLALLMRRALEAAELSEGDVDPTLGRDLASSGYDRDFDLLDTASVIPIFTSQPSPRPAGLPGWRRVSLDGRRLTVPDDLEIDLGATAKAVAADLIAALVAERSQTGVLVSLGGDIATAGPADGWEILVQDLPQDPAQQVALTAGAAVATSSTQKRAWTARSGRIHHILDPRTGLPSSAHWKSVTVVASSCWEANVYSTASVVRGQGALRWLAARGIAARLVDQQNRVFTAGEWPEDYASPPSLSSASA